VVKDSQSGFRAFRRETMRSLGLRSSGMELASEMLIRAANADLRIKEVEAGYRQRVGESKLDTFVDGRRHLALIFLLAPDLLLVGPGATLLALGVVLTAMGFLRPAGVAVGSLRWQPVFFSSICLVLGTQALLAGAVLANRSAVSLQTVRHRFDFIDSPRFPSRCFLLGLLGITAGLVIDLVMFVAWIGRNLLAGQGTAWAGLAQSLLILGGSLASFGVVSRFLRRR
jgi:hypothetical protein